jgi:hypothetical protein
MNSKIDPTQINTNQHKSTPAKLDSLLNCRGRSGQEKREWLIQNYDVESIHELTAEQLEDAINWMFRVVDSCHGNKTAREALRCA